MGFSRLMFAALILVAACARGESSTDSPPQDVKISDKSATDSTLSGSASSTEGGYGSPSSPEAAFWLDSAPHGWNTVGMPIPTAPAATEAGIFEGRCKTSKQVPLSIPEKDVVSAGWTIVAPVNVSDGILIVTAAAEADGMCRPWKYQQFVFTKGRFAGTVAPRPMDSRIDGSAWDSKITKGNGDKVYVTTKYSRYTDEDPLCCPSRESTVRFQIISRSEKPVLVPIAIDTKKNPHN